MAVLPTPAAVNQPATYWHDGAAVSVPAMVAAMAFNAARVALAEAQVATLDAMIADEREYGERLDAIIARVERVLS